MKLYTSYFYQIRNFPRNLIPLSTAFWPPKYTIKDSTGQEALIIDCPPLKPGAACEGLCNGGCNPKTPENCEFLKVYRKQLDEINIKDFIEHLNNLRTRICTEEGFDDIDFAFIVYEAPTNTCSERISIQEWLRDNGIEVEEWKK